MNKEEPRLRTHYRDLESMLVSAAKAAGIFEASTTRGNARELVLNNFLRHHLPQRLSVTSGEVIDASGGGSGQLDAILRDDQSLAWGIGGQDLVPVEAAPGVIEIKTTLEGDDLERSFRKVRRVKELERIRHHGFYHSNDGAEPRVPTPPRQTACYIVAFRAPSWDTLLNKLRNNPDWFGNDYLKYGPELVVVLERGVIYKADNDVFGLPVGDSSASVLLTDVPGLEMLSMHVVETVRRYGSLNYQLTAYVENP